MDEKLRKRAKRLQQSIPLGPLLQEFGYYVRGESPHEQQFSCDLHGGADRKPSARFYPHTNSTFCWACHQARGPLDYWMAKREVSFATAVHELEVRYQLPDLLDLDLSEDDPELEGEPPPEPWEETLEIVTRALLHRTREGDGSMACILEAWELLDECHYQVHSGQITKAEGLDRLREMRQSLRGWRGYDTLSLKTKPSNALGL